MGVRAERVEQARQAWNAGDLDGYLTLYDESIALHGYGPQPFDNSTVVGFYRMIWAALAMQGGLNPGLEFHEVLEEGDLYCCRFTMVGIHQGDSWASRRPSAHTSYPASRSCGSAAHTSSNAGRVPISSAF